MDRYSKITNKNKREIVLLKALPCAWGKCRFCDYIEEFSSAGASMMGLVRRTGSDKLRKLF